MALSEKTVIRENLMSEPGYSPYCGNAACKLLMPRTKYDGEQFACMCGFRTEFPESFLERYRKFREENPPVESAGTADHMG